jgi:superfamily I DNA/RNA helicase
MSQIQCNMPWDTGLEGPAKNIAGYTGKFLRVKAGPGTGKTYALMRRVSRLLEGGVTPSTILAISFTKTAANDLIKQLNNLGIAGAEYVNASTLHSLAFKILNQRAVFESMGRIPRPLLDYEKDCLIADLSTEFGGKRRVKELLLEFESFWATLQHLNPGFPPDDEKKRFQLRLREWLVAHEAILIGELIPLSIEYIRRNPTSAHAFSYAHVLVDEYQDLNRADQEFIEALARNGTLTVIGDDDQSIYGFRFARPEGILTFHKTHEGTVDEQLLDCRRCPQLVVRMANSLISHNSGRSQTELRPLPSNCEGNIHIVQHDTIAQETQTIADFIDWYLDNNPNAKLSDILILATRRKIGYAIRDHLLELGHLSKSFFAEESLEKISAKEGFCLLTLLCNPRDKVALRTWLCVDKTTKRVKPYERLVEAKGGSEIHLYDYLNSLCIEGATIPAYTEESVGRFKILNQKLVSCAGKPLPELIDILWPPGDPDCEEIRGLAIAVSLVVDTVERLRDELMLVITQPELLGEDEEVIRIMSLHKSKGLTAKCIVIAGCVSGALPMIKEDIPASERQKKIEEFRRLFYVAITRTTETLVISNSSSCAIPEALQMGLWHLTSRYAAILQASQYISELGDHGIEILSGRQWRDELGL